MTVIETSCDLKSAAKSTHQIHRFTVKNSRFLQSNYILATFPHSAVLFETTADSYVNNKLPVFEHQHRWEPSCRLGMYKTGPLNWKQDKSISFVAIEMSIHKLNFNLYFQQKISINRINCSLLGCLTENKNQIEIFSMSTWVDVKSKWNEWKKMSKSYDCWTNSDILFWG